MKKNNLKRKHLEPINLFLAMRDWILEKEI